MPYTIQELEDRIIEDRRKRVGKPEPWVMIDDDKVFITEKGQDAWVILEAAEEAYQKYGEETLRDYLWLFRHIDLGRPPEGEEHAARLVAKGITEIPAGLAGAIGGILLKHTGNADT